MKDQYFGDVNDYRKYGLLRSLTAGSSLRTGVCWMLTVPDGRSDGKFLRYLERPDLYAPFDPELFDSLKAAINDRERRGVHLIEKSPLLPGASYIDGYVPDSGTGREEYFDRAGRLFSGHDLLFFDPDNGLEVKSRPWGRVDSSKFLFWREVERFFAAGHSLLIYQHFPRRERNAYRDGLLAQLRSRTGAGAVFAFQTPRVLFLLASQERHTEHFVQRARGLSRTWPEREIRCFVSEADGVIESGGKKEHGHSCP